VLLSAMAWRVSGREVFLPDGSDANWTSVHRRELRARHFWREPSQPAADGTPPPQLLTPPSALRVAPPWYPREARYLWHLRLTLTLTLTLTPTLTLTLTLTLTHARRATYGT